MSAVASSATTREQNAWREQDAWCAGLIDGEGSIGIYGGKIMLRVVMTDEHTIRTLQARLGGPVRRWERAAPRMTVWRWYCRSRDLLAVLKRLRPYLVTKAVEADAAIRLLTNPLVGLEEHEGIVQTLGARKQHQRRPQEQEAP